MSLFSMSFRPRRPASIAASYASLGRPSLGRLGRLLFGAFSLAATLGTAGAQPAAPAAVPPAPEAKPAEAKPLGEEWVRVTQDERGEPNAMQVAIVTYRGRVADRVVEVDLIGAVHVGDAVYYQQLNERFTRYDALLYELVAPEGHVVTPGEAASQRSPLGAVQGGMKTMLELEHQLEIIDYNRPNFVHADMSPEEFFKSMEDRGEGVFQMLFRMMGQGIAMQSKQLAEGESTDIDLMRALFSPDRARQLKIVFARQMAQLEVSLGALSGEGGSTLITERNKTALGVLRREINAGKSKLGVFYGAGHLSDMDDRLREQFGLLPEAITWLTAWDLAAK